MRKILRHFLNQGIKKFEVESGKYYRIIQFKSTPSAEFEDQLNDSGIKLLEYIPNRAFYASFDIEANLKVLDVSMVHGVYEILPTYKLTKRLVSRDFPEWSRRIEDRVALNGFCFQNLEVSDVVPNLEKLGQSTLNLGDGLLSFEVEKSSLNALYQLPFFIISSQLMLRKLQKIIKM